MQPKGRQERVLALFSTLTSLRGKSFLLIISFNVTALLSAWEHDFAFAALLFGEYLQAIFHPYYH